MGLSLDSAHLSAAVQGTKQGSVRVGESRDISAFTTSARQFYTHRGPSLKAVCST